MNDEPRAARPEATGRATAPGAAAARGGELFSPTMQRVAAASGVLFVLFTILSVVFSGGESPDWADPAGEYVSYSQDNADEVQLSSLFLLLAAVELLWFTGFMRGELGRVEARHRGFTRAAHPVLAGGTVAAAGLALVALTSAVAVSQPADTSPDVVRALHHLSFASFSLAAVGLIGFLAGAGLLILRSVALPKWLGIVALIGSLAYLLTLFIVLSPEDEDFVFGFAWFPGFLALLLFALASSVVFLRRIGRPDALDATDAPARPG